MKTFTTHTKLLFIAGMICAGVFHAGAQRPQDNWYLESTWSKSGTVYTATNGGLSAPYGVAIAPDGRIYVGDQGYGCIQVYKPDGTYLFSITNGFGGGLKFSQPRGMITDQSGNLYVADYGTNCVYAFTSNGTYIRKFGNGVGAGNGQLTGVIDVAVSPAGQIHVLENGNGRVSIFNPDGSFSKVLIGPGTLDSQLDSPVSIAISDAGQILIAQNYNKYNGNNAIPTNGFRMVKAFDKDGIFLWKADISSQTNVPGANVYFGPCSIRTDPEGQFHVISGVCGVYYSMTIDWGATNCAPRWNVFAANGTPTITVQPT